MPKRASEEGGWILVTAISLMAVMLVVALASMAIVDTQQTRTREQRERESSLNVAEGALFAQGFQLARAWPGTQATAVLQDCSSAAPAATCPTALQVQQNADNVDTRADTTWTTLIRDNGGNLSTEYQPAFVNAAQIGTNAAGAGYTCPAPCRWDANGDLRLWVQSSAVVRGRPRSIVATLQLERIAESTPRAAVTAGGVNTVNNGSQVKIYAVGSSVVVRCAPATTGCVSDQGGIQPAAVQGNPGNMMTPSQIERMKATAIARGTYYDGCANLPTIGGDLNLAGQVVFIECPGRTTAKLATSPCTQPLPPKPTGGGNGLSEPCINSQVAPGLVIWRCGSLELSGNGNGTYIGTMYFANSSDSPTTGACAGSTPIGGAVPSCDGNKNDPNHAFVSSGGFGVWGALAIDGNACLYAGSNGMQVQFDANAFNALASFGAVGLVQDTWRELAPN